MLLMSILLGIAVSLDGLLLSVSYGAKGVRLTVAAVGLVSGLTAIILWLAMQAGRMLAALVPAAMVERLGAFLLLIIGGYVCWQTGRGRPSSNMGGRATPNERKTLVQVSLKALGLMVHIWHDPSVVDFDGSGSISWQEAFFIGLALSLDSFGVGVAAHMSGLFPHLTALVAGMATLMSLLLGWELGYRWRKRVRPPFLLLPGMVLIGLGLFKLFCMGR